MNLVEINLSDVTLDKVTSLCENLSRRFLGCTLYKTIGYCSEECYQFKKSYEGIREEQGYGIKILIEEDLDQVEKIIRTCLSDTKIKWVQIISYDIKTNHLELKGES